MTREERIQLENLSKLVYGNKNRYKKMIEKGEIADLSEKLEDGTERKYRGITRYSVEEVKNIMEEIWAEELERQEKAKNEEENKKFHEEMKTIDFNHPDAAKDPETDKSLDELRREGTYE